MQMLQMMQMDYFCDGLDANTRDAYLHVGRHTSIKYNGDCRGGSCSILNRHKSVPLPVSMAD